MTEPYDTPVDGPAAWKGRDMATSSAWMHELSPQEVAELEGALANVKSSGLQIPDITRDDFPLATLSGVLAEILRELEFGRGFALIRGLPVERYGEDDAAIMYWGIGAHFGKAPAQNMMGDLFGHVQATGRDWDQDYNVRGYQTTSYLPYHCDKGDVVGLLCLQTAKSGGLSCIASAVAIHDEILRTRPDLLHELYEPNCIDLRGEEFEGNDPYYVAPVFTRHQGRLFSRFGWKYVESAQRFPDATRLTPARIEAMELVDALAWSDEFRLDMGFRQGDMQFLNNHVTFHSRTEYDDYDEPGRRRHLLRLLLLTPAFTDVPPSVDRLNDIIRAWGAHPRPAAAPAPVG